MKSFAERFYKSRAWDRCRESYIKLMCGICERCGDTGKIVHHQIYLTPDNIDDPEVTLCFDHLELLCQDCHNKEHNKKQICSRYYFDKEGNIIMTEK